MYIRKYIFVRLIAIAMIIAFSFQNIAWANPDALQVQSKFAPFAPQLFNKSLLEIPLMTYIEMVTLGEEIDDTSFAGFKPRPFPRVCEGYNVLLDFKEKKQDPQTKDWIIDCTLYSTQEKRAVCKYKARVSKNKEITLLDPTEVTKAPAGEIERIQIEEEIPHIPASSVPLLNLYKNAKINPLTIEAGSEKGLVVRDADNWEELNEESDGVTFEDFSLWSLNEMATSIIGAVHNGDEITIAPQLDTEDSIRYLQEKMPKKDVFLMVSPRFVRHLFFINKQKVELQLATKENIQKSKKRDIKRHVLRDVAQTEEGAEAVTINLADSVAYSVLMHELWGHLRRSAGSITVEETERYANELRGDKYLYVNVAAMFWYWFLYAVDITREEEYWNIQDRKIELMVKAFLTKNKTFSFLSDEEGAIEEITAFVKKFKKDFKVTKDKTHRSINQNHEIQDDQGQKILEAVAEKLTAEEKIPVDYERLIIEAHEFQIQGGMSNEGGLQPVDGVPEPRPPKRESMEGIDLYTFFANYSRLTTAEIKKVIRQIIRETVKENGLLMKLGEKKRTFGFVQRNWLKRLLKSRSDFSTRQREIILDIVHKYYDAVKGSRASIPAGRNKMSSVAPAVRNKKVAKAGKELRELAEIAGVENAIIERALEFIAKQGEEGLTTEEGEELSGIIAQIQRAIQNKASGPALGLGATLLAAFLILFSVAMIVTVGTEYLSTGHDNNLLLACALGITTVEEARARYMRKMAGNQRPRSKKKSKAGKVTRFLIFSAFLGGLTASGLYFACVKGLLTKSNRLFWVGAFALLEVIMVVTKFVKKHNKKVRERKAREAAEREKRERAEREKKRKEREYCDDTVRSLAGEDWFSGVEKFRKAPDRLKNEILSALSLEPIAIRALEECANVSIDISVNEGKNEVIGHEVLAGRFENELRIGYGQIYDNSPYKIIISIVPEEENPSRNEVLVRVISEDKEASYRKDLRDEIKLDDDLRFMIYESDGAGGFRIENKSHENISVSGHTVYSHSLKPRETHYKVVRKKTTSSVPKHLGLLLVGTALMSIAAEGTWVPMAIGFGVFMLGMFRIIVDGLRALQPAHANPDAMFIAPAESRKEPSEAQRGQTDSGEVTPGGDGIAKRSQHAGITEEEMTRIIKDGEIEFLRDLRDTEEVVGNMTDAFYSLLYPWENVVLAFDENLSGFHTQNEKLIRGIELWKKVTKRKYPKLTERIDSIRTLSFSSAENLKAQLEQLGIDTDGERNIVFTYTQKGKKELNIGQAMRLVYIEEKQKFSKADYFPLAEIVTISLIKELLSYDRNEIIRIFDGLGFSLEELNIEDLKEENGALIFTLLPKMKQYNHNDRVSRYTRLLQFLRAA